MADEAVSRSYETIEVTVVDRIAALTISRPQHLNALNDRVLTDLDLALTYLEGLEALACLVVTGKGKAFVAGADISEMERMGAIEAAAFSARGQALFGRLSCLDAPVIAAVNGYAMACDIRVASSSAKFGQPEVGLGIIPGFGGTRRMSHIIGAAKAFELILSGRIIDASEALSVGLVNKVVPEGEALAAALEMAGSIASKSTYAVRSAKKAINTAAPGNSDFAGERALFASCFDVPDQKEGMRAFLEKRPPKFL